jgi:hypothetical protein
MKHLALSIAFALTAVLSNFAPIGRAEAAEPCQPGDDYFTITRCITAGTATAPDQAGENSTGGAILELDPCTLLIRQEIELATEPSPAWRPAERTVYFVYQYLAEVQNGGVHQFFFNPSGDHAPEIVTALREIGVPEQASLLEEGIAMFPQTYPTDIDVRRRLYLSSPQPTELEDRLDALTDRFDDAAIGEAALAYATSEKTLPACPNDN